MLILKVGRWRLLTFNSIYSASLYTNNRYGTVWFVYLGSAACGLSAGIFWAAEGAIMLSYPEPNKRGRYLAYWLAYRNVRTYPNYFFLPRLLIKCNSQDLLWEVPSI